MTIFCGEQLTRYSFSSSSGELSFMLGLAFDGISQINISMSKNTFYASVKLNIFLNCIHLSNVLTDHFSNSLPEITTKDIPMKFSQCLFKNIFSGCHSQIVKLIYKSFM